MNFCKECGNKLEQGKESCENCGTPVTQKAANEGKVKTSQPLTKEKKIKLSIGIGAVAVLIGLFLFISHLTSPERLVNQFTEAVEKEDTKKLAKLLNYRDTDEEISETEIQGFLKYIKEERVAEHVSTSLDEQLAAIDEGGNKLPTNIEEAISFVTSSFTSDLILLEEKDGFLFFDSYQLAVQPVDVYLSTNLVDTTLFMADEEVVTSDSDDFNYQMSSILPGRYTFRAVNSGVTELELEEEYEVYGSEEHISLYFDATYVFLDILGNDDLENRVYINGEETDFNAFSEDPIGPVLADGSMSLYVEVDFPWGTMKSTEEVIESEYVSTNFETNDELLASIETAVQEHLELYLDSWEKNDLSQLEHVASNLTNNYSKEFQELHEETSDYHDKQYTGITLDPTSITVKYLDNQFTLRAKIKDHLSKATYTEESNRNMRGFIEVYDYDFIYGQDGWVVFNKLNTNGSMQETMELDVSTDVYTLKGELEVPTASLDTEEAKKIATTNLQQINEKMYELQDEYNMEWFGLNLLDFDSNNEDHVDALEITIEELSDYIHPEADKTLSQLYLSAYFCECDVLFHYTENDLNVGFELVETGEESFVASSLELDDEIFLITPGTNYWEYRFHDGNWKLYDVSWVNVDEEPFSLTFDDINYNNEYDFVEEITVDGVDYIVYRYDDIHFVREKETSYFNRELMEEYQ
ncbi:zinc ribbon domain-containing protein [Ornithinibacillus halophilus]|uniref:Uncharacterized membrane protein YvbJ n=1 Tax=Ornithinibacillus halophilus TaxID=930117 RepID=A0A1M5GGP1_9BACI|nr:hypothetical protein [Ornithinibacillus halophilus]SHG02883.1 Uncharacterized membrane protein YvbJ [Ornithinibacillus halophilus]